jgi:ABC-type cobalt transport system substrate-binding protein
MKVQSSKFKVQSFGIMLLLLTAFCILPPAAPAGQKWSGVDESVIEKFAKEHGREAREPLINTDQGDLLIFLFLIAGAVGGFAAGYYWRMLVAEKAPKMKGQKQNSRG